MRFNLIVLLVVITTLLPLTSSDPATESAEVEAEVSHETIVPARFKFRKLLNFDQFKAFFNKHYSSLSEELVRRKIFLGQTLKAFVSGVSYSKGLKSWFLYVNQMSDWTPKQIEDSKLSADKLRYEKMPEFNDDGHDDDDDDDEIEELEVGESRRQKRNSDNVLVEKTSARKDGSFFGRGGYMKSLVSSAKSMLTSSSVHKNNTDFVTVDHRMSNCLLKAKNQGRCGSCYIFAPVALFEWYNCIKTSKLVAFSEQYLVDCGASVDLGGCNGGSIGKVFKFPAVYGLELQEDYPYRAMNGTCPHDNSEESNLESRGYLRFGASYKCVEVKRFEHYLKKAPLLVNLNLSQEFRSYGGGVHEPAECHDDDAHSMLIVGSGRERGKDYWLLRNSHSIYWGEDGYYKISKEALNRCKSDKYALRLEVKRFSGKPNLKHKKIVPPNRMSLYDHLNW